MSTKDSDNNNYYYNNNSIKTSNTTRAAQVVSFVRLSWPREAKKAKTLLTCANLEWP